MMNRAQLVEHPDLLRSLTTRTLTLTTGLAWLVSGSRLMRN